MIPYSEALALVRAAGKKRILAPEQRPLMSALGLTVAEELRSPEHSPAFANSAMDGFAVRSEETRVATEAHPLTLTVLGAVAAGDPVRSSVRAARGCTEIMTGAPLPEPWDAVIKIEEVELEREPSGAVHAIRLRRPVRPGENVRDAGEDFQKGMPVLAAGEMLMAEGLLALAGLGFARVPVRRRPRVAVISTGKELVDSLETPLHHGQIRNSTGPYLVAALPRLGAEVVSALTVGDSPSEFVAALKGALQKRVDVILTTGAVSMGKHDFIVSTIQDHGWKIVFHKVSMRPGKPLLFADSSGFPGTVFFGLPGNPVSTAVGLRFFVDAYLRALTGRPQERRIRVRLEGGCRKPEGLTCFYKARLEAVEGALQARILPGQASFMVRPLVEANAWALLPEAGTEVKDQSWIEVVPMGGTDFIGGMAT